MSVTFHPTDPDKTFSAIITRCKSLYPGYQWTEIQYRDIDRQLTDSYKDYDESRNKRRISEADHLVNLAMPQIKQQFRDQTGALSSTP